MNREKEEKWIAVIQSAVMRIISACFLMSLFFLVVKEGDNLTLSYVDAISLPFFVGGMIVIIAILSAIAFKVKNTRKFDVLTVLAVSVLYAVGVLKNATGPYVSAGIALLFIIVLRFFVEKYEKQFLEFEITKKQVLIVGAAVACIWVVLMLIIGILRYVCYASPNFDMGIFSQMFYYMKKTFAPITTCERYKELSHFAVHVSPALYVFLPIYFIFPSPVMLVVIQVLFLISGVIPLYKICKNHKLSNYITLGILIATICYPALAGGCFYDFHENMMLFPCLLWLFYFMEKKKTVWFWVFVAFTLLIKEDAAFYVACIGLYMILGRKEYKKGGITFGVSLVWFFLAIVYLKIYGDGLMTGRYANYLSNQDDSFFMIFATILKDPAYALGQIFTKEKMEYFLWILVPILALPAVTKKPSEYILLIPTLLVNLLTSYQYQFSIFFQYSFGTMAMLFYIVTLEIGRCEYKKAKKVVTYMTIASLFMGCNLYRTAKMYVKDYYMAKHDTFEVVDSALKDIPEDASVEATTFLIPKLSQRKVVYQYQDAWKTEDKKCDYLVIDLIYDSSKKIYEENRNQWIAAGYQETWHQDNAVVVFEKQS